MQIRLANDADVPGIRNCATEAYEKYVERIGRKPAPMIAEFEEQVRKGQVYVAADDIGSVLGFIVFYRREDHIHLENVAVSVAHHGQGIGTGLIAFCEAQARAMGLGAVELYTNAKMTENLTLYPRIGYRETERRHEDGFNRVYFRKDL